MPFQKLKRVNSASRQVPSRHIHSFRGFRASPVPPALRRPPVQDGRAIQHAAPEVRTDSKLQRAMRGNADVLRFLGFDSRQRLSTEEDVGFWEKAQVADMPETQAEWIHI